MRARPQPYGESFGEILVGMTLRVPQPQILNVIAAGGIGPVITRVTLRRGTKQLLPAAAAIELIGMGDHMSAFMPQDAHALGPFSAFDFENHFLFQLHQPGMRQIKRDGDARGVFRAEPFTGNPGVRPDTNVVLIKLAVERLEAAFEPGALDRDSEIFEPDLEQLIVGQRRPGKFLTWHGTARPAKSDRQSCHGESKATTGNADSDAVFNILRRVGQRGSKAPTDPAPA